MGFRFFSLTIFFTLLFGLLGFNCYRLQIEKGEYYFQTAQARSEALQQLQMKRGQILFTDRSGNSITVALNQNYPVIYAVPKEIVSPTSTAAALASSIGWSKENLFKALSAAPQSLFRMLVEKATPNEVDAVQNLNLKGVYVTTKQYRYYPYGDLASQLIGFVGFNTSTKNPTGLYGIEKESNDILSGGENVQLTIDRNLQALAEQKLKALVKDHNATGGSVIMEDPMTGKILVDANFPSFDPNYYSSSSIATFLNKTVQAVYEPGSVFKPITMAAGIDLGILTPQTTYDDKGYVILNGKKITNWNHKAYGPGTTMTQVIEHSLNTGAVWAEQKIGRKNFYDFLVKFGLDEKTGIDLPDEVRGSIANLEERGARDVDYGTASYGQGISVTPMQMINAFSVFANGGLLMRPYVHASDSPYVIRRVVSTSTAAQVVQMMQTAVEKGDVATIPQFHIAGKTGTANVPDFQRGGYLDKYIHTFIGIAPVLNPKMVILVKLDEPAGGEVAASTVVPAFRELARFVLNYYNVPPDNPTHASP